MMWGGALRRVNQTKDGILWRLRMGSGISTMPQRSLLCISGCCVNLYGAIVLLTAEVSQLTTGTGSADLLVPSSEWLPMSLQKYVAGNETLAFGVFYREEDSTLYSMDRLQAILLHAMSFNLQENHVWSMLYDVQDHEIPTLHGVKLDSVEYLPWLALNRSLETVSMQHLHVSDGDESCARCMWSYNRTRALSLRSSAISGVIEHGGGRSKGRATGSVVSKRAPKKDKKPAKKRKSRKNDDEDEMFGDEYEEEAMDVDGEEILTEEDDEELLVFDDEDDE